MHDLLAEFFFVIVNSSYRSVEDEGFAVIKSEMMDYYSGDLFVLKPCRVEIGEGDVALLCGCGVLDERGALFIAPQLVFCNIDICNCQLFAYIFTARQLDGASGVLFGYIAARKGYRFFIEIGRIFQLFGADVGHPCLRLTVPTAKSVADFHRQVIAHAERTTRGCIETPESVEIQPKYFL